MATLALHRFTVKDYYRMAETGVLRPDERVELLEGSIIDMSPIGPTHGGVVNRLTRLFFTKFPQGRWSLAVQNPVRLEDLSEPQPDVMLLRPTADDYASRHPTPEDVFLLIEVSDSTIETDREVKLPIYAKAGIREVWLVNLVDGTLEVYSEPGETGYAHSRILNEGETIAPAQFPDVVIDVTELMRR